MPSRVISLLDFKFVVPDTATVPAVSRILPALALRLPAYRLPPRVMTVPDARVAVPPMELALAAVRLPAAVKSKSPLTLMPLRTTFMFLSLMET